MSVITNDENMLAKALEELKYVDDPEIGLNVVDLGLIYEVDFWKEENKILCTMTLTTEFCPMGDSIINNVRQALEFVFSNYTIQMILTFDPPWDFHRITEAGREFLGR